MIGKSTMKVFGALSKQGTYFNCNNKKLSIRGWFLSDTGYDQIKINGIDAVIGLRRPDVYNSFKEYEQINAGFALEYFSEYEAVGTALQVEAEVLNKGHSIYKRMYEVPVFSGKEAFMEHIKNQDIYIFGLDSWIEKVIYTNKNILENIKGFYDEKRTGFYNVPKREPDAMFDWGG